MGGNKPIQLDLRFLAATNKDLKRAVAEGRFREDLYFRLNVVQITLPSLLERQEDIPLLLQHFLNLFSHRFAKKIRGLDREVLAVLRDYAYPGNVRELQNIMERAVALAEGEELTLADLPQDLQELAAGRSRPMVHPGAAGEGLHPQGPQGHPIPPGGVRPHPGLAPHHPLAQDEEVRPVPILRFPGGQTGPTYIPNRTDCLSSRIILTPFYSPISKGGLGVAL